MTLEVLTVAEMAGLDARAADLGVPTATLMENAGRAVAAFVRAHRPGRPIAILCGPGDNGGDGYVAARLLAQAGVRVRVYALSAPRPGGAAAAAAAAHAASAQAGDVLPLEAWSPDPAETCLDALFGAGLARPLSGAAAAFAGASGGLDAIAVDLPSGLPGDGAAPLGPCVRAGATLTFVRKKPAHLLTPGRMFCGAVTVADIGAPAQALAEQAVRLWENAPALWPGLPRAPAPGDHKHVRGKVAVWARASGAPVSATFGAQRLAARSAARLAGWVSVFAAAEDARWFAEPAALVVRADEDPSGHDAIVFGCGAGQGADTRAAALRLCGLARSLVLDADALSSFEGHQNELFTALPPRAVLTPHAGEFRRLFPAAAALGDKVAQARAAAAEAGACVILKGYDTVIAAPDGRCAINANAPAHLATAGTGDVLAGVVAGLLAAGADPFAAACCAVWLHGEAASRVGAGLIADDLITALPGTLRALWGDG